MSCSMYCKGCKPSASGHDCEPRRAYQRNDDFAVGCRLEVVGLLEVLSNETVVVDFAVDCEDDGVVGVGQRLGARLCDGC
jgi:hypothetical protein